MTDQELARWRIKQEVATQIISEEEQRRAEQEQAAAVEQAKTEEQQKNDVFRSWLRNAARSA